MNGQENPFPFTPIMQSHNLSSCRFSTLLSSLLHCHLAHASYLTFPPARVYQPIHPWPSAHVRRLHCIHSLTAKNSHIGKPIQPIVLQTRHTPKPIGGAHTSYTMQKISKCLLFQPLCHPIWWSSYPISQLNSAVLSLSLRELFRGLPAQELDP